MIFLQSLWSRIWPYIAAIGAAFAAVLAIRQSGKAAGRQETRQEINEAEALARKEVRRVEDQIDSMGDDSVRDRAGKWVRGSGR
jgi:hypothetical protein